VRDSRVEGGPRSHAWGSRMTALSRRHRTPLELLPTATARERERGRGGGESSWGGVDKDCRSGIR
jgi:hypothetical protein